MQARATTCCATPHKAYWNVFAKRPLASPAHVITYFARDTRRIAISNRRLVRHDGERVTFRWRDRAHDNRQRLATLDAPTFCRRTVIDAGAAAPGPRVPESRRDAALRIFGLDPNLCPTCQKDQLVIRAEWGPTRAPLDTILLTAFARAP